MAKAKQTHCMTANETRNIAVSFVSLLDSGELLTGTPTVTASGLTIANKVVNVAQLTIDGDTVEIGQAVQFNVTGGTAGTSYDVTILCDTDASTAQTLEGEVTIQVE